MNVSKNSEAASPHLYDYRRRWKLSLPSRRDLRAMIYEDRAHPGDWRVEKLDSDGETCHVAAFSGPLAWQRVLRYADQKYGWCEQSATPKLCLLKSPDQCPPGRVRVGC